MGKRGGSSAGPKRAKLSGGPLGSGSDAALAGSSGMEIPSTWTPMGTAASPFGNMMNPFLNAWQNSGLPGIENPFVDPITPGPVTWFPGMTENDLNNLYSGAGYLQGDF